MKDINNLTDEERERTFSLLKPIGYKEGDDLYYGEVIDGKLVREVKLPTKVERW